jgi:hypothetical protein
MRSNFHADFIAPPPITKDWRQGRVYRNIIGITTENMENGTGGIERLKYPPWDSRNDSKDDGKTKDENGGSQSNKTPKVLSFGKYKGRTKDWVKENDINYYNWAAENIKNF